MARGYNAFVNFVTGARENLDNDDEVAAAYYAGRADHMRSRRDREWSELSSYDKKKFGSALDDVMEALELPVG